MSGRNKVRVEKEKLSVENTREALRQIQRYTTVSIGAALSLVLVEYASVSEPIKIPGAAVPVDPSLAIVILAAIYIACGFLLFGSIILADKVAGTIEDAEIRALACGLPTLATSEDSVIKWVGNLLAPSLFVIFVALRFYHDQERSVEEYFFLLLFGVAPYGGFLNAIRQPLGSTGTTYRLDRQRKPRGGSRPTRRRVR